MTYLDAATCVHCRVSFKPESAWQMFCPDCLQPATCRCENPIIERDEDGERCFRCGAWRDLPGTNLPRMETPCRGKVCRLSKPSAGPSYSVYHGNGRALLEQPRPRAKEVDP